MFQIRSESTGIKEVVSLREAITEASVDTTIWKISFSIGDERIRLIRDGAYNDKWILEQIELPSYSR